MLLALLYGLVPLVMWEPSLEMYLVPKACFVQLLLLVAVLRRPQVPDTPLTRPLFGILAVGCLSILGCAFPWLGIESAWSLWCWVLLYHVTAQAGVLPADRHRWYSAVSLSLIPVSCYGIAQVAGWDLYPVDLRGVAVSTLGNQGFVGGYLAVAIPMCAYTYTHIPTPAAELVVDGHGDVQVSILPRWSFRWVFLLALCLGEALVIVAGNRTGMVGVALGVGLLAVRPSPLRRMGWHMLPLFLAVLLLSANFAQVGSNAHRWTETLTPTPEAGMSTTIRLAMWRDLLPLVRHRPMYGLGLGNFQAYSYPAESEDTRQLTGRLWWDHAHNEALEWVLETGILGGLALVWVCVGLSRLVRVGPRTEERVMLFASAAGLSLFLGLWFPLHEPVEAAFAALLLGCLSATNGLVPHYWRAPRWVHLVLGGLLIVQPFLANVVVKRAWILAFRGESHWSEVLHARALRIYPPMRVHEAIARQINGDHAPSGVTPRAAQ